MDKNLNPKLDNNLQDRLNKIHETENILLKKLMKEKQ